MMNWSTEPIDMAMPLSMAFATLCESPQAPVPPKFVMITRTPVESPRTPARVAKSARPSPKKGADATLRQTASATAPPPPPPPLPMMSGGDVSDAGADASAAAAAAALDRQAYAQWTFAEDCALLSFLKSRGLLGKKLKERQMKDLEAEKIPELHARRTFKAIYNRYNKHLAGPAKAACLNEDKNAQESSDPFLWLRRLRREAAAPPVSRSPKSPRAKRKREEERVRNRGRTGAAQHAAERWAGAAVVGDDHDGMALMPMGDEIVMIPIDEDMDAINALVSDKSSSAFFSAVAGGATASLDDALHASIQRGLQRLHDADVHPRDALIDDDMEIDIGLDMDSLVGGSHSSSAYSSEYGANPFKRSNSRDSGDFDVQHVSNSNSPQAHTSSAMALPLGDVGDLGGSNSGGGGGGGTDELLQVELMDVDNVWPSNDGATGAQWERSRDDGQALFFGALEMAIENK